MGSQSVTFSSTMHVNIEDQKKSESLPSLKNILENGKVCIQSIWRENLLGKIFVFVRHRGRLRRSNCKFQISKWVL